MFTQEEHQAAGSSSAGATFFAAQKKAGGKGKGKGKGKTGGRNPPAGQPSSSSASSFRVFHELVRLRQAKKHFMKQADVCYKFQSRMCSAEPVQSDAQVHWLRARRSALR